MLFGGAAHWDRTVRVGAAVYMLVEHFCVMRAPFTRVVVVMVVVSVEVMGHLTNEGTIGMQAHRPATWVGLTTLVGKKEEVILKIGAIHWLEREGERERIN